MMALAIPALVGVAGLSTETGYLYLVEKRAQAVADVSAFTGAVVRAAGNSEASTRQAVANEINGSGIEITSFSVNLPPTEGAHQNARAVEVVITKNVSRVLTSVFSSEPVPVSVRSVAIFQEPATACLLSLNTSAPETLSFSGAVDVALSGCELMSNSIADDAIRLRGSARVEADCVSAVGGIAQNGGSAGITLTDCPAPREHISRALDPYEDVAFPSTTGPCNNLTGGGNSGTATVSPGSDGTRRFCNGLTISRDTVFEPGVYVIDGGTFRLNGNNSIFGMDVTFALTGGAEIQFNGDADINLTAPTTGPYAGLVFFGDPMDSRNDHSFNGSASSMITGAIYTPTSHVDFRGNFSGSDGCFQLVADTIEISGSVNFSADCDSAGIRRSEVPGIVSLVE